MEKHNLMIKFVRLFTVPLLNSIPSSILKNMMKSSSKDGATVVKHGGSNVALEALYTRYHRGLFSRGALQGFADSFWHHYISQPKAVRNRLKIVEKHLEREVLKKLKSNNSEEVTILTIGGGSARAIIQFLKKILKKNSKYRIRIINVDRSEKAIEQSKKIAKEFNVYKHFKWIHDDARNIKNLFAKNSVDIVEMVGLLDYFSYERSIEVLSQIYDILKKRGFFVVANIRPNSEMPFVRKIGWPKMYYKEPKDLSCILKESGFSTDNGLIILEPLRVHIIATIRK